MTLPKIAVLLPAKTRDLIMDATSEAALAGLGEVIWPTTSKVDAADLPALIAGADVAITGWGTPTLTEDLLAANPSLKLVAHTAGSIHRLVPHAAVYSGRIAVSHAAVHIAEAVSEFVIAQILMFLRTPHLLDQGLKDGGGWDLREIHPQRLLGSQTVGIVGAGYVGRLVIGLLKAFGARVLVCDPLVDVARAATLGVERADLNTLFATCDIVSMHAPVLDETRHMVSAHQFALLRQGTLFVNSARSALVDEAALLAALLSGRFTAALDVFDNEPLPADSPFRTAPNLYIAPHAAGHTIDTHKRQGHTTIAEVRRYLAGEALQHRVTPAMLATMA